MRCICLGKQPSAPLRRLHKRTVSTRGANQAPDDGASMSDKSPRQGMSKKSSKSIKEKRAEKRAKGHTETLAEAIHPTKKR